MGVKQLYSIIDQYGVAVDDSFLNGKTIAVDAMSEIYRCVGGFLQYPTAIAHFNIALCIRKLLKTGARLIYVFDNEIPPALKQAEIDRRNQNNSLRINSNTVKHVIKIVEAMKIPYIIAPQGFDAEHICAYLTHVGDADIVLSGDSDVFMYGGRYLLRRRTGNSFTMYDIDKFFNEYHLTFDDMRKIGVCLGTDYANGVPRIGPKTVLNKFRTAQYLDHHLQAIAHFASVPPDTCRACTVLDSPPTSNDIRTLIESACESYDIIEVEHLIATVLKSL